MCLVMMDTSISYKVIATNSRGVKYYLCSVPCFLSEKHTYWQDLSDHYYYRYDASVLSYKSDSDAMAAIDSRLKTALILEEPQRYDGWSWTFTVEDRSGNIVHFGNLVTYVN